MVGHAAAHHFDGAVVSPDARAQCVFALQRAPGRSLLLSVDHQRGPVHFLDEQAGRPKPGRARAVQVGGMVLPLASGYKPQGGSGGSLGKEIKLTGPEYLLYPLQVFLRIHSYCVVFRFRNVNRNSIFQ